MSGKQAVPFHGILAVGTSKDEAINRYRLLAQGKGVSAMIDEGQSLAFVTHASNKIAEMFNPSTGELDLQKDESLLKKLNFEAQASGEANPNYYVCASGCGLHVVYDSEALMKHCPACTIAVASDDDEDDEEEESEDDDSEDEDEDDTSESADDEDDEESDDDEDDSEEDDDEDDESEDDDDSDGDDDTDDEDGDADDEDDSEEDDEDAGEDDEDDDSGEPLVIAADSKEKAVEIYQQNRQGIATAATTVEVDYMVCSSAECNAHVLSEDPSVKECPACASPLKQPVEASTEQPAADTTGGAAPAANADGSKSESGDDEDDEEDEDDSDLNVVDEDDDADDDEEDEDDSSESKDIKPAPAPAAATASTEAAPAAAPKETAMTETAEKITVNMLTQIDDTGEKAHQGLDLSFSASIGGKPLWTAFYNGQPVATASKDTAGKNADIFADAAFGNAVIASAKHVGVKATLSEMGFVGIAHEISISSVVANQVEEKVKAENESLSRDRKEHAERLMAALASAAIGLNRGFFPDLKNPMKVALWGAMSSAGVKNAEVLIDNAFKNSSDAYHTSLFAKACEIIDQPLEVQESLSKAILGSNYMAVSESSGSSSLENRLENFGSVTASAAPAAQAAPPQKQEATAASFDATQITAVVKGLGRRH